MRAEAGVFDMFSLPLLRGDPQTALARPHTLVLTEPLARRLFGESDPIGEVVRVGGIGKESDYEVTGIVGQPPAQLIDPILSPDLLRHHVPRSRAHDPSHDGAEQR